MNSISAIGHRPFYQLEMASQARILACVCLNHKLDTLDEEERFALNEFQEGLCTAPVALTTISDVAFYNMVVLNADWVQQPRLPRLFHFLNHFPRTFVLTAERAVFVAIKVFAILLQERRSFYESKPAPHILNNENFFHKFGELLLASPNLPIEFGCILHLFPDLDLYESGKSLLIEFQAKKISIIADLVHTSVSLPLHLRKFTREGTTLEERSRGIFQLMKMCQADPFPVDQIPAPIFSEKVLEAIKDTNDHCCLLDTLLKLPTTPTPATRELFTTALEKGIEVYDFRLSIGTRNFETYWPLISNAVVQKKSLFTNLDVEFLVMVATTYAHLSWSLPLQNFLKRAVTVYPILNILMDVQGRKPIAMRGLFSPKDQHEARINLKLFEYIYTQRWSFVQDTAMISNREIHQILQGVFGVLNSLLAIPLLKWKPHCAEDHLKRLRSEVKVLSARQIEFLSRCLNEEILAAISREEKDQLIQIKLGWYNNPLGDDFDKLFPMLAEIAQASAPCIFSNIDWNWVRMRYKHRRHLTSTLKIHEALVSASNPGFLTAEEVLSIQRHPQPTSAVEWLQRRELGERSTLPIPQKTPIPAQQKKRAAPLN